MKFKLLASLALSTLLTAAHAAPKVVEIDTQKSSLNWTGEKVTGSHHGTVKIKSGTAQLEDDKLIGGKFEMEMGTIKVIDLEDPKYNKKLTDHLNSDDFFSTANHPTSTFTITKAEPIANAAADSPNYTITGDLSIKGMTFPLTFPATVVVSGDMAKASATAKVDRTKYNIRYGSGKFFQGLGDKLIYDEFTVKLDLVGTVKG